MMDGDHDEAERILDAVDAMGDSGQTGSRMLALAARAELALARGRVEEGLRGYDVAVESVAAERDAVLTLAPWLMLAASGSLVSHVLHGHTPGHAVRARELRDLLVRQEQATDPVPYVDLPLKGIVVVAVSAWLLRFGTEAERDAGVRLLATGERWSYNRSLPAMAWAPLRALAERVRPGRVDVLVGEYADRPGYDLVEETRAMLTSSG
jgi:hypothetical protein